MDRLSPRQAAIALTPLGKLPPGTVVRRLDEFERDGTIVGSGIPEGTRLQDGRLWSGVEDRGTQRHLHSLLFIAELLGDEAADKAAPRSRDRLLDVGRGIRGRSQRRRLRQLVDAVLQGWWRQFSDRGSAPKMAYHDETTAQRLLVCCAVRELLGRTTSDVLEPMISHHFTLLSEPDFYAGRNNHGLFQDVSLLVAAVLGEGIPVRDRTEGWKTAVSRIDEYVREGFTPDGVHIEHSPSYHLMVSSVIRRVSDLLEAARSDVFPVEETAYLRETVRGAERFATHLVTPAGVYPPISDTAVRNLATPHNFSVFDSDEFRYAVTRGSGGVAPEERALVFESSGYGVFRSSWGDRYATWALFTAAYNGGYHKHSDELQLIVRAAGVDLLHEAGPYGYNYGDLCTKYAYSSFGHNTLIVDDNGLPRHDGKTSETWIEDLGTTSSRLRARGVTTRYQGVEYSRTVDAANLPSRRAAVISVIDRVASGDTHDYSFLWHVGPEVDIAVRGHTTDFFRRESGAKVAEMTVLSDAKIRLRRLDAADLVSSGSVSRCLGWYFPDFGRKARSCVLAVQVSADAVEVSTKIRVGKFASEAVKVRDG